MKFTTSRMLGYGLVIILAVALVWSLFGAGSGPVKEIPLSQVIADVAAESV